jgi:D-alanine-D-alanine ligase-like ATP-grasp enzyme
MENSQRAIVKIITEICAENGITCQSFSYDWIFRLTRAGKSTHVFGYQFEINPSTAQLICSDKSAASDLLISSGIPTVAHTFFMSPINMQYVGEAGNWKKLQNLLALHGSLVCKTNEGTGGNQVYLVSTLFELEEATYKIFGGARSMAVSPYYEIECEYRVVILKNRVKLIYIKNILSVTGDGKSTLRALVLANLSINQGISLKTNLPENDHQIILNKDEKYYLNWKHNLGQGASPEIVQDETLITRLSALALQAAEALHIQFASIDIIKTGQGYLILEINSGVMMEYFSQVSDEHYQIVKEIYKEAIEASL